MVAPRSSALVPYQRRWLASPAELAHDHAQVLPAKGHLDAEQPLDRQREAEVVEERRQVVHPVRVRDALLVGVALEVLLEPGVEVADIGTALTHHLAVEIEHQAQHPVRRGMHRPHVQFHGAVPDLDEVDGIETGFDAEQLAAGLVLLAERVERRRRRARRRERGHRDPPGMSRGRSCAGSAHSRLWVKAIGSPNDA